MAESLPSTGDIWRQLATLATTGDPVATTSPGDIWLPL
ncbi:hypothetical protein A2U01_0111705, partial [Trifolium medium]|nr:hypothetical protein [Trifolium medium]